MSEQNNLFLALEYALRGWLVFPTHAIVEGHCTCNNSSCGSKGKHPLSPHGFKDASRDNTIIEKWWGQHPHANVAVRTGKESGLVVVDIDPCNGGDESLQHLFSLFDEFPRTPVVYTGGDGIHFYFAYPHKGPEIKCTANLCGLPGIDIKAEGGYVVAPNSTHISGQTYRWAMDNHVAGINAAPLPPWLLEHLIITK